MLPKNHVNATSSGEAKRILILMSNTGGGHRAAAVAIQEALIHLYNETVAVTIVDAWRDHVAWPINRFGLTYGWIVSKALWFWKSLWLLEKQPCLVDTLIELVYPLVAPGLLKLFNSQQPEVIVSVHPLITRLPLRVLRRAKIDIPFIIVVTDMVCGYHTWYDPQTTLCLVSTEPARQQAISLAIAAEKVEVVGHPVALKFATDIGDKTRLRRKLGLDLEHPIVLLVSGSEGYGPVFEIARCIARHVPQAQLVIVAGRNRLLREKLGAIHWEIPTTIFGFVENMPELMGAADVLVTKAGPGSISEAFVAGLPLILFAYIPGQEEGNVRYVVEHNAGTYAPEPEQIANLLLEWLQPDNPLLAQMTQNAAALARPGAALTIARRVYEQATSPTPTVSTNA